MKKSILFVALLITGFMCFSFSTTTSNSTKEVKRPNSCQVQLIGLKCIVTEGNGTADKIYMKMIRNGETKRVSPSTLSMNVGDYVDLTGTNSFSLNGEIGIELWDDDMFDADDFLGREYINCNSQGSNVEKYLSFTEDGASYKLYYKVY